jgi:hypothetical protein
MPARIYSLGVLEVDSARRSGSTDTGCVVSVTWALAAIIVIKQKQSKKTQISNLRNIQSVFRAAN